MIKQIPSFPCKIPSIGSFSMQNHVKFKETDDYMAKGSELSRAEKCHKSNCFLDTRSAENLWHQCSWHTTKHELIFNHTCLIWHQDGAIPTTKTAQTPTDQVVLCSKMGLGAFFANVVWETMAIMTRRWKYREWSYLVGSLVGQKRRQHMKEKEKKTLDTVCQALNHISAVEYTIPALINCCLDRGMYRFYVGSEPNFCHNGHFVWQRMVFHQTANVKYFESSHNGRNHQSSSYFKVKMYIVQNDVAGF